GIAAGYRHAGEVLLLPADEPGEPLVFTERACCPAHRVRLDAPLSPRRFSFNHHQGACPECAGLGLVPRDGRRPPALRPDPDQPPRRPEEPDPWGSWASTAGAGAVICPACQGERLAPLPRRVTLGGARLPELTRLSVTAARQALAELELGPEQRLIARDLLGEVDSRLRFLEEVGLGYLTLDRTAASLSGGEAQRIRLASQLGAYLTGCLYVLDEPTVGLHPRDTDRLLHTLESLRDQGNTVVVVEHDLDTIRRADWLLDLGPGPGELGGRVVAAGTPDEVARTPGSLTGDYLAGRRGLPLPTERRTGTAGLEVRGARANNLRGVDAGFAWGLITCVTGVSGSGKSSLVLEVLQQAAARALGQETTASHDYDALLGTKDLTRLVVVDQSPLGRTPRSNPASYTGLLDLLRTLFAGLPESKTRGYGAGRFSYNRAEGRCPTCEGMGALQVEMHFLSDVWVPCDACQGARYNEATLQVRYRGLSFADVLRLTVDEAAETFAQHRRIARILGMLQDVGLGYLRLGQAATTLSGGEAQRLKLATELGRRGGPGTLYLLDEPTTGLHPADVERLLAILQRLAARQAAVVVIEHNPEVIRLADRVLDLGPEGGAQGGELVVAGTPEEVAACARSHTGRYLGPLLAGGRDPRPASVCDGRRAAATRRPRPTRPAGVDSPDRLG
ncbi:MAG: ATP-binding cassette domain-containing protein, partial [Myxococcota bacterium]|nr:ATP-binding cassette domain-containing protein [Myxococcota bacterium]